MKIAFYIVGIFVLLTMVRLFETSTTVMHHILAVLVGLCSIIMIAAASIIDAVDKVRTAIKGEPKAVAEKADPPFV